VLLDIRIKLPAPRDRRNWVFRCGFLRLAQVRPAQSELKTTKKLITVANLLFVVEKQNNMTTLLDIKIIMGHIVTLQIQINL
jgi:hypothetical protein